MLSDRNLSQRAYYLYNVRKERYPEADGIAIFENQLEVFYNKFGIKKKTKTGISLSKSMTVEQRKEMRGILRKWVYGEFDKDENIKKEYERKIGEYIKGLKNDKSGKIKVTDDVKEMRKQLKRLTRILQDRKFLEELGSDVLNQVYYQHVIPNSMKTDDIRKAMAKVIQKDISQNDTNSVVYMILQEYEKLQGD